MGTRITRIGQIYADFTMNKSIQISEIRITHSAIVVLSGNVWEWCQDWYDEDYYNDCAKKGAVKNPLGPGRGSLRVRRGGGWINDPLHCRVAYRGRWLPDHRYGYIRFRLCLTSSSVESP